MRRRARGVFVHHASNQFGVERAPIDTDSHWLVEANRRFDHRAKLVITFAAVADIARIDAQFRERMRAIGNFSKQFVAVEMEIADQRNIDAECVQLHANFWRCARGFHGVHGDTHHFGTGTRQRRHLCNRCRDVFGIGVGHRLHHDRCVAADQYVTDRDLP